MFVRLIVMPLFALAASLVVTGAPRAGACAPLTKIAPTCNTYKCTFDGWVLRPLARGTACTTSTGEPGLCDGGGSFVPGKCIRYLSGALYPTYQVLSVIYAPPGRSSSFVDYGYGTSWGTTTSTTHSWKNTVTAEDTFKSGVLFADGTFTVSLGNTWSGERTTSVDTKTTVQTDWKVPGGAYDGLDHDYDQIHILLNPQINVLIDPFNSNHVLWTPTIRTGEVADTMWLYAGQLRGTWGFSQGEADRLAAANITAADYAVMLAQDPVASGTGTVDPARFVLTPYTFDYKPVPTCADNQNASTSTVKLQTDTTTVSSDTLSQSYTVGMTVAGTADVLAVKDKLMFTESFTYTISRTSKVSDGTSAVTILQMGQPYCDYQGGTAGHVYLDTLYRTYLFTLDIQ